MTTYHHSDSDPVCVPPRSEGLFHAVGGMFTSLLSTAAKCINGDSSPSSLKYDLKSILEEMKEEVLGEYYLQSEMDAFTMGYQHTGIAGMPPSRYYKLKHSDYNKLFQAFEAGYSARLLGDNHLTAKFQYFNR